MTRRIIPYNKKLVEYAKQLRKKSTVSEIILWKKLKGSQVLGYDFHRQKPIGNYIVDFFCYELMLAIEIDGLTHFDQEVRDKIRQQKIESLGISILRFGDRQVKKNVNGVIEEIKEWVIKNNPPRRYRAAPPGRG